MYLGESLREMKSYRKTKSMLLEMIYYDGKNINFGVRNPGFKS